MRKVTIKDIANALGLSTSTVSRVLNDRDDIDENTRKLVKQKARELGYVPNMFARALKGKRMRLLGVVIDDNANPFYAEVIKGMEKEARKSGFHLLVVNTGANYKEQELALTFLQSKGIDGILVAPVNDNHPEDMHIIKIPFVVVGRHFSKANFLEVYNDEETGGYLATRRLLERGCRRIMIIQPDMDIYPVRGRMAGYHRALKEFDMNLIDPALELKSSPKNVKSVLKRCLKNGISFDGVFAYNDLYAMEVLSFLFENNIHVPEDVAVVGYDDIPYSKYLYPRLTTIALDEIWLGKKSVELLIKSIENKNIRKKQYVQKPILRVRNSG